MIQEDVISELVRVVSMYHWEARTLNSVKYWTSIDSSRRHRHRTVGDNKIESESIATCRDYWESWLCSVCVCSVHWWDWFTYQWNIIDKDKLLNLRVLSRIPSSPSTFKIGQDRLSFLTIQHPDNIFYFIDINWLPETVKPIYWKTISIPRLTVLIGPGYLG